MLGILAVVAFICLNGFFVAAEFSLVKLRATQQGGRKQEDANVARAVEQIDRYLSVTQLGITLASLGLGWIGEPTITRILKDAAERVLGHPVSETIEHVMVGIAFSFITFGHVLFGELVPKLIAIQRSQGIARIAVLPLRITYYVLLPALWLLENSSRRILGLFGLSLDMHSEAALSEEEILGVLAAQIARGPGGEHKEDLLRRVVRFGSRVAKQAMVPRVDVFYLPVKTTVPKALESLRNMQFSRVPLSKETTVDQIAGYVYWKDLSAQPDVLPASLDLIMRPVLYVAEAEGLVDVLRKMQQSKNPFAVVVDEYGGTSGILTMEDLLEEIVGEIRDELDEELMRIEQRGAAWEVDGTVLLDELAEVGVKVAEDERQATVGGAVVSRLQRLPRVGDKVDLGGVAAEVIGLVRRRVTRVRLKPPASPAPEATATPRPEG